MKHTYFAVFAALAMLSACGPNPTPAADPGQAVQQATQGMSAGTGAILGGVAGYMLGRAASPRAGAVAAPPPQIVHHTIIQKKTVIVQQRPRYVAPRPSYRPSTSYRRR